MDQDIAISIHVPKLLEWLISRRHCKKDWQTEVVKIRGKINVAIQDMPAHETIASLLSGTYINYFHCLKIIEILEKTEADSKNFFGGYSSKRMKDWKEIVSLYKKNNVYIAEAADLLINTAKYEVPNIKKSISKQEQTQNDCKKKEADAMKCSNSSKNELSVVLKEVGLDKAEKAYRKTLITNARHLGATHHQIVSETKNILPALQHYQSFTAISLPQHTVNLTLVQYIAEKGNTTVYELEHGEAPTEILLPPPVFREEESQVSDDVIDWGTGDGDQGITLPTEDDVIDWGIESEDKIQIELVPDGHDSAVKKTKEITSGRRATGEKALSVLDNMSTRTNFINQLLELKSFVRMRLVEARKEGPIDDIVESVGNLEGMSKAVQAVISLLTSKTSQHFYNILYMPGYLDGLVSKIKEKEDGLERWAAIGVLSREKGADAASQAAVLLEKTQLIIKKAKTLQEEIRKDISERYEGRTVTLLGGPSF